jgi:hypothetical protein
MELPTPSYPPGTDRSKYPARGLYDRTLGVLNEAAALGDVDLFDWLVSRGADASKSIALHTVARCKDPAKTKAMISHLIGKYGFDPNADDNATGLRSLGGFVDDGGHPLRFAVRYQNLTAVEALLQHGADPSRDFVNPVMMAESEFPAVIEVFRNAGVDIDEAVKVKHRV